MRASVCGVLLGGAALLSLRLKQIPKIAIEVLEDSDRAIDVLRGRPHELHPLCPISFVVPPEIIGVKEKKYPTACLRANSRFLLLSRGSCQQQLRLLGSGWGNDDPPLGLFGNLCVFDNGETKLSNKEVESFVVVADHQRHKAKVLLHSLSEATNATT